jgi:hypothetical protein
MMPSYKHHQHRRTTLAAATTRQQLQLVCSGCAAARLQPGHVHSRFGSNGRPITAMHLMFHRAKRLPLRRSSASAQGDIPNESSHVHISFRHHTTCPHF